MSQLNAPLKNKHALLTKYPLTIQVHTLKCKYFFCAEKAVLNAGFKEYFYTMPTHHTNFKPLLSIN